MFLIVIQFLALCVIYQNYSLLLQLLVMLWQLHSILHIWLWHYTSQDLAQLTDKLNMVLWIVFYGGVDKKIYLTAKWGTRN
jgi:hypothetical protein